jgi:phosphoenolpyruvate-protein phosphotransferase
MHILDGIGVSDNVAMGKAYVHQTASREIDMAKAGSMEEEIASLENALEMSRTQIDQLLSATDGEANKIVSIQLTYLEDPEFVGEARKLIEEKGYTAGRAISDVTDELYQTFSEMEDEVVRERAADIRDVGTRIFGNITGRPIADLSLLPENTVLVAEELTPSQTAQLDKRQVVGFVVEKGNTTSHVAIMARAMGLATVLGCARATIRIHNGQTVIVDGENGTATINPDPATVKKYEAVFRKKEAEKKEWAAISNTTLRRKDGSQVLVAANVGNLDEAREAKTLGADGIGLFRTEFLFLGRREMPGEEEQYQVYAETASIYGDKPVVIRTLDIGGDKPLPYLDMPKEENPFLGVRAIRLCLQHPEFFKTQLMALLRASASGNLHIMFPMISSEKELARALALLEECKTELASAKVAFNPECQVGIMVETPAAAILAGRLAKKVDFFSIGTNDLLQYTTALDRGNAALAEFVDPLHPAVLELVRQTIAAAHDAGIWCGMCGEMAADKEAISVLADFGLDEFSVNPGMIAATKARLMKIL